MVAFLFPITLPDAVRTREFGYLFGDCLIVDLSDEAAANELDETTESRDEWSLDDANL